ncbi:hypothetical protein CB0940_11873 [Cercospora beticola]|uniref:Uncharacterized protein n=1 Tax=Cercospora beticola TaxID=122368 RepID=A0A2G5IER7_CERBT|nr:hypothetical protein CB0940_11873 [Cercospora beticola]PIB03014.1 hypothetical protein CB0940_11873 [Cercospora beticola]
MSGSNMQVTTASSHSTAVDRLGGVVVMLSSAIGKSRGRADVKPFGWEMPRQEEPTHVNDIRKSEGKPVHGGGRCSCSTKRAKAARPNRGSLPFALLLHHARRP